MSVKRSCIPALIETTKCEENASPATAAEMLPAGPHSQATRAGLGMKQSTVPKLKSPLDPKVDDRELVKQVIDYYIKRWRSHV
jgi:hypothetical protein